jgi:hypothetical protein
MLRCEGVGTAAGDIVTDRAAERLAIFISHASGDGSWAEWIAWQLRQAGYSVELDLWDWKPGEDFVARMQDALHRAERVVAVWSPSYFAGLFATAELRAAFAGAAPPEGPGRARLGRAV